MSLRPIFIALSLTLLAGACGQSTTTTGDAASDAAPGAVASAAPSACDSPATPVATGVDITSEVPATSAPYPANARYYCFNLPAGTSEATLRLTGLTADLDLYVGHGSINTVQGVDVSAGETYEWKSNAFGAVDESVTISNPTAGTYYAEIVSYEGNQSSFTFSVR